MEAAMRYSAILVAALALAACAGDMEQPVSETSGTSSPGGSVTYKYGDDVGEAGAKAAAYCAKYRKRAWLRSTSRAGDDNLATYDCR
jgi:hypothetical protein